MIAKEVFDGVVRVNGKLATVNLVQGEKVYGEELVKADGKEYRLWNPYRSKLAAAILKGMKHMQIKKGSKVLYLGAATGTTCHSSWTRWCSLRSLRDPIHVTPS